MENKNYGISFVIGIILTGIISVNTNLFKSIDTPFIGFIVLVVLGLGVTGIVYFLIGNIVSGATKYKEKVTEVIQKKKLNSNIETSMKEQQREYDEIKNTHKYFSDEKLLEIYKNGLYEDRNFKQLALEEILVEKKLVTHSVTHEKMQNLKEYFLEK